VYPAKASCATAEHLFNLLLAHSVKVVRHRDLPRHETEPPHLGAGWSIHKLAALKRRSLSGLGSGKQTRVGQR